MRKIQLIVLLSFCLLSAVNKLEAQESWSPDQVFYGENGTLSYTPDEQGNIIPDYSHVGYMGGDDSIPNVPVKVEVSPVDGDDATVIQDAIDQVSSMDPDENGIRGAVLLKAGEYQVSGQITISTSGVVLRGEGNTDSGTVIIAEGTDTRDLIKIDNGSSRSTDQTLKVAINESYVPVGRKYVVVTSASNYSVDDDIIIYRPGTDQWITDIKMDQITASDGIVQWTASSYNLEFERKVTQINGDTIFFTNPIVMAMETIYGGGSVYKYSFNRLQNIGVEDLCLKSEYASETDEEHSWNAVKFLSVENGWAKNITAWYFAFSCINLERNSKFITVDSCNCYEAKSIITGGRRYSFNLVGSMNLFKNCTSTEGRHDYVTSSKVCGPNVFTNCKSSNAYADIGPHQRWAIGTLYDVIETDGEINVQDRDDMGSGHGWAGANQVFWNCKAASAICQSPWESALNYNFGFIGTKEDGARSGRPDGEWVGHNEPGIFPTSLYDAQLSDRKEGTIYFSAMSTLVAMNDSVFVMSFNQPLVESQIINENFEISGTAGAQNSSYSILLNDEYSVKFTFSNLEVFPAFSTVIIKAQNLTSTSGNELNGVTTSTYTEPDKRPVVSGIELTVDNVTGFVVASSTKEGHVYLVLFGEYPSSVSDLDSLISIDKARGSEVGQANVSTPIYATGLTPGLYVYYATDTDGRVSEPDTKWVRVEQGPTSNISSESNSKPFTAYKINDQIFLEANNDEERYAISVYTIIGKLVYTENNLKGNQYINLKKYPGVLLIKRITENNQIDTVRIIN